MARADFRSAKVVTPSTTYEGVRFIFANGTVVIWSEDKDAWTADKLGQWTGATFIKRSTARNPHIVQVADEQWEVTPLYVGGCGCNPYPLKGLSYTQLLDPDFTHVGG